MLTIRHNEEELIRDFVGRSMAEKIKVVDYSDEMARSAFITTIIDLDLKKSFALQSAQSYNEVIQDVKKHMNVGI